jgi:cell division septation protein DedD
MGKVFYAFVLLMGLIPVFAKDDALLKVLQSEERSAKGVLQNESCFKIAQYYYARALYGEASGQFTKCAALPGSQALTEKSLYWGALAAHLASAKNPGLKSHSDSLLNQLLAQLEPENQGFMPAMVLKTRLSLKDKDFGLAERSFETARKFSGKNLSEEMRALCSEVFKGVQKPAPADCNSAVKPTPTGTKVQATKLDSEPSPLSPLAKTEKNNLGHEPWVLQLGAFSSKANAERLQKSLSEKGITVFINVRNSPDLTLYLIQTEPFPSRQLAESFGNEKLLPNNIVFQPLPLN